MVTEQTELVPSFSLITDLIIEKAWAFRKGVPSQAGWLHDMTIHGERSITKWHCLFLVMAPQFTHHKPH